MHLLLISWIVGKISRMKSCDDHSKMLHSDLPVHYLLLNQVGCPAIQILSTLGPITLASCRFAILVSLAGQGIVSPRFFLLK